jgi:pimeloyl-ACP methyl ester carboxylesterase
VSIWASEEGRSAVHARYAEILGRWPVPVEQRRVSTREGETFIAVCGPVTAPPLVLMQGSGANAAMWTRDIAFFAQHHRVFALDVIGEPGFSAPSRPPLTSEAHALWLDDVMDALGLTRGSLVGVSLGGWLALDYAIRRPGRVEKAVVISPAGVGRQKAEFFVKAAFLMLLGGWGRRKAMSLAVGPMNGVLHPTDREVGALALLISKHFHHRRARVPIFGDAALAHMTAPLLAIVGARDALLDSQGTADRLQRLVPGARIRLLPDAGHLVRNQAVEIVDFLKSDRPSEVTSACSRRLPTR